MITDELKYVFHYLKHQRHHPNVDEETMKHRITRAAKNFRSNGHSWYYIKKGRNQLVVSSPEDQRKIIEECHKTATGEHRGLVYTKSKVNEKYYWCGMTNDITNLVKTCKKCCNSLDNRKTGVRSRGKLKVMTTDIWNTLALTFLGPFEETIHGHHEVCLIIDYVTQYVYGEATFTRSSLSAIKVIRNVCYQYGVPKTIIFTNTRCNAARYKRALSSLGVDIHYGGLYEQNSMKQFTECTKHLSKRINNIGGTNWESQIKGLVFAHNITIDHATELSPFQNMFKRRPIIDQPTSAEAGLAEAVMAQESEDAFLGDEGSDWQTFDLEDIEKDQEMDNIELLSDFEADEDMTELMGSLPVKSIKVHQPVKRGDTTYYMCETKSNQKGEESTDTQPAKRIRTEGEILTVEVKSPAADSSVTYELLPANVECVEQLGGVAINAEEVEILTGSASKDEGQELLYKVIQ